MDDQNEHEHEHSAALHELNREPSPHEVQSTAAAPNMGESGAPSTPAVQTPISVAGSIGSLTGSMSSDEYRAALGRNSDKKPSKWRYVFIVLGILQLGGVGLFVGAMIWASIQAGNGVSGTEFLALILFVTLVPAVGFVALLNFVGLPIYMLKQKPKGKGLVFGIISLVISALLMAYAGYTAFQMFVVFPSAMNDRAAESRIRAEEYEAERVKASYEITQEEAIRLLQSCSLKGFYYTDQTDKDAGGWGELSTSGVVVTEVDDKPYRISIADRLIPEMVPIAREAQKTCANPQFWHDGNYEQYKDGKWYFGTQVVNATQSGKTKDEALAFMQGCKADYFVGYTDISRVKDANTKTWLDKAEKSTTGIEISEDAKSYVFVSKSMTMELQNAARQFRSSCYGAKKLYVTIDDWIETEYPMGTWTRVKS